MPSGDGRWAELSSQNERVIRQGDPEDSYARAQARWAELDSSSERLVEAADRLAGASRSITVMALEAGAA